MPAKVQWRDFEEARVYVRGLGLQSETEWRKYLKSGDKPRDIPASPSTVYADDWLGWGDWLGTGRVADQHKVWRDFEEARQFARGLGLRGVEEWRAWAKTDEKPKDIPASPRKAYMGQWAGWGDWLGTGNVATFRREYRPFEEAREYVRSLGLRGLADWRAFATSGDKPKDIPSNPDRVYKAEWAGMGDWLGTGNVRNADKRFRSFEEAREFVRSLGLQDYEEWCEYRKSGERPPDIPAAPNTIYRDKWRGYGDWLGTGKVANLDREYRAFQEAREFVRSLGLKNVTEWYEYCKSGQKPDDIPSGPHHVYGNKWKRR